MAQTFDRLRVVSHLPSPYDNLHNKDARMGAVGDAS